MKTFNQFQENAASVTIKQGSKLIPALMTGVGAVGTYLQSRKKKEKPEDLLGAVRKAQDRINTDVANQKTIDSDQVKKHINKEKSRGKYVVRKPEGEFH